MSKKTIILTLALILLLVGAYATYNSLTADSVQPSMSVTAPNLPATSSSESQVPPPNQSGQPSVPKEPVPLPDALLHDANNAEFRLTSLVGKPVVLNFWASWCPPCQSEMPDFQSVYEQYGDRVHFVMINLTDGQRETVEKAKSYIEKNQYTFPVYFDTQGNAASAYGISSIPATYVADAKGNLYGYQIGVLSRQALAGVLETLLAQ